MQLSQDFYVRSRTLRAAAVRVAYIAYTRALLQWDDHAKTSREAALSLRRRIMELFAEDWQDARDGVYPRELIDSLPWLEYAQAAPRLLADLPRTRARMQREDFHDLPADAERYPPYYARNFHFQTDGYLGYTSAQLYDLQVELLFGGTADAMRRRLLKPLVEGLRQSEWPRVLDVACGTGHFLRMAGAALPDARFVGLDLSPHYLARARETLPRDLDVSLICENAEKMPFLDGYFDAVTSVFLFHEIPHDVRARVLREMARVVKPGGRVIVADSIQLADAPELSREILTFPARFHEPYYKGYVQDDLAKRLGEADLTVRETKLAFLTKVVVAEKA